MSLADTLKQMNQSPYYDIDQDWTQYVRDHIDYIRERSTPFRITNTAMPEYRYNIRRFMKDRGYPESLWWIILEVNNLRNDMDFNQSVMRLVPDPEGIYMTLYIPNVSLIDSLHDNWSTTAQSRRGSSLSTNL